MQFTFLFLLLVQIENGEPFIYRLITETLQNNVAGEPITHERTNWDFDPDVSQKRRSLFYEVSTPHIEYLRVCVY